MKIEDLKKYFEKAKSNQIQFQGICHDCKQIVIIDVDQAKDGKVTVKGGALYKEDEKLFMKCDGCFKKNPILENFRKCDVYSRVVGFLRPVKDWNKGKRAEWENRVDYELETGRR